MASFDEHISQVKRNLLFLEEVNKSVSNSDDWQVTTCFYVAVHLVNAHLSHFGSQYRKHVDVNYALNPEVSTSITKVPEPVYLAYIKLQNLSRRARYLCNDSPGRAGDERAFLTYTKHVAKAIRHLNTLITFFAEKYGVRFERVKIKCPDLSSSEDLSSFIIL